MEVKKHQINTLKEAEYNPRRITDKQMSDLKKSIIKYGIVDPIIINMNEDRKMVVIGGHQRLKAVKELGYTEIDCVELDLTLGKEKELNVRLNKNNGEFDFHELIKHFSRQEAVEFGFDLKEIEKGLSREAMRMEKKEGQGDYREENKAMYLEKWQVKEGDLWQLGDHKLICGNSLDKKVYDKLLGNEKVQCIFTDPPYGVVYNDTIGGFNPIANDELKDQGLYKFLDQFLKLSVERLNDKGSVYIWHATRTRRQFEDAIKNNGLEEISYIIWVKDCVSIVSAFHYKYQHEPCFFLKKQGKVIDWYGNPEESMIWELNNQEDKGQIKSVSIGNGIGLKELDKDPIYITRTKPNKKIKVIELNKSDQIILENPTSSDVWYIKRDPAVKYLHPTQKPIEHAKE